jgi:hypothetical protein
MYDGWHFLSGRKAHGLLPGLARNDSVRVSAIKTEGALPGPWFLTTEFHLVTKPPTRYYGYVVVQTYSNADFQLQKAWQADASGKTIKSFPVAEPARANPRLIFYGPANPGAEIGFAHWYNGTQGSGTVALDGEDPATGGEDFQIGIQDTDASGTNHADLRSEMFSLKRAGQDSGPVTLSFQYKLPSAVKPGDNIDVDFRFFGPDDDNFLGQEVYQVGASTGDSEMTAYKTMTVTNISPASGAVKADVWVVANIFDPWTSGLAQFDDFSVTTLIPRPQWPIWVAGGLGLCGGIGLVMVGLRARSVRRRRAGIINPAIS